MGISRRRFLSLVGVGFVASSLPVAIAACQDSETPPTATTPNPPEPSPEMTAPQADDLVEVGDLATLETQGFILNETAGPDPVLVVKNGDQLQGLNPTCTHKGCVVDWEADSGSLLCPCHRARFAADGEVLEGPAQVNLAAIALVEKEGKIYLAP